MAAEQVEEGAVVQSREHPHVITVRLSPALHDELKREAHEQQVSLNRLCLRKLVLPLPPPAMQAQTG